MSLVRLQNVSKSFDSQLVLRNIFFRLKEGDRVGLIGKNGVGKTTTLKLILGQEEPTEGTVEVEKGARIGYCSQFSELSGEASILEVLEGLFADIHALEAELTKIDLALEDAPPGTHLDRLLKRQAALLEEMEQREGWTYHNRIDTVLTKLKFSEAHRHRSVDQLSGGWRNRAALAKLLVGKPDVLLMDEPTNFLDVEGLLWLEQWFTTLRGSLIVVSHDRSFLDNVVTRIVERQFKHEEELLAFEAEAITDRHEAARDPSHALKRRLANIKKKTEPRPVDRIVTGIYEGLYVGQKLCQVENISKAYDGQVLFRHVSFELQRGQRMAIVGANGCGKTTLLRVLTGLEGPDSGQVSWARGDDFVYYNQVLDDLDLEDTVTHAVNIVGMAYRASRKKVNRFLSLLQFSEMDLHKRIGTLSGGQRARVTLARCLLSGAAVVVLDEPTNHLDLTSTQVMERALVNFPGAVVVVSHDRFFVDKVATRLLIFEDEGRLTDINGNWTIWQASRGA